MELQNINPDSLSLVTFDLDDTLAESKQPLDAEMAGLLAELLKNKYVAVMSGASFFQFEKQFLGYLAGAMPDLNNLYLLPTSGASLYSYKNTGWVSLYYEKLTDQEKEKIMKAFYQVLTDTGFPMEVKSYGQIFEDRGSQITFSALGQEAPISAKSVWDPDQQKRQKIAAPLRELLPEFSVKIGGSTSVDITKKGIDKAYGIKKLMEHLNLSQDKVLYVGDALFPGGNDEPLLGSGVMCQQVAGVSETKELIKFLIKK